MAKEKSLKISNYKYNCICCDYFTNKINDYEKHLTTAKHQRLINANNISQKVSDKCQTYECDCGKVYKHISSLCKHKKTCELLVKSNDVQISKDITPELIIEIIKQNKELQQTLIEQNKTIIELANKAGTNTNYINSNNNKTFNLQVFLNETCKDAINLTDFVNQIQLSVSDLEVTGKLCYAEGIS
jgi:hypothetical protein